MLLRRSIGSFDECVLPKTVQDAKEKQSSPQRSSSGGSISNLPGGGLTPSSRSRQGDLKLFRKSSKPNLDTVKVRFSFPFLPVLLFLLAILLFGDRLPANPVISQLKSVLLPTEVVPEDPSDGNNEADATPNHVPSPSEENVKAQLETLQNEMTRLKEELAEEKKKGRDQQNQAEVKFQRQEEEHFKVQETARSQLHNLQINIQRDSMREAVEKFGPGPHYVDFEVDIPGHPTTQVFTLEMAPLNVMPHSVNMFLRQVAAKLWDGTTIPINAVHTVLAKAMNEKREDLSQPFREALVDTVAFPETSDQFHNRRYVAGFSGRPGEPELYVRMTPNDDTDGYPDPFAKVVRGIEVVRRISEGKVEGPNIPILQDPIRIKSVRIQQ